MKIKDCCKVIVPMRDKPKNFSGNIPWCRIDDIDGKFLNGSKNNLYVDQNTVEKMHLHVLPAGTVICAVTGASIGTYAITTTPLITNQTFAGIVCGDSTYNEYLYYFLKLYTKVLINLSVGCAQAYLTRESIENIDIGNLSFDQQVQKAKILKNIDEKIVYNNAISSQLESLAKTIYDYWFLQFDFPDENGNPYRSSGGKMVWNDELKREIPEGWESTTLSKLCHLETTSIKPSDNPNSIYFHYSIPAFDKNHYPAKELGSDIGSNKYLVPENSILVSKLNPHFKRIWDPQFFNKNTICSTEFMPLVVENVKMHGFVYSLLNSDIYQTFMIQASSSSTGSRKRLQPETACNFITPLPLNNKLLENYSKIVNPMLEKIKELTTENKELSSLRDFLLPLLMNGQVTFKED